MDDETRAAFGALRQYLDGRFGAIDTKLIEHDDRFGAIDARLIEHDGRFADIDGRFVQIDGRFTAIDGWFVQIDGRFTAIDGRFVASDGWFAQMDDRLETLDRKVDAQGVMLRTEILSVAQMVAANTESIALLRRDVDDLRTRR